MVAETQPGASIIDWGIAARPYAGQSASGDHFVITPTVSGVLVAVIDGLGHGVEAAAIAQAASATLEMYASEELIPLLKRCHQRLQGKRGAAISIALFNGRDNTLTWSGVGNVEGTLFYASTNANPPRVSLVVGSGIVGYRLPTLQVSQFGVVRGDTLLVTTDGIDYGFAQEIKLHEPPQQIAERILTEYGKQTDDALALAVRYVGHQQ